MRHVRLANEMLRKKDAPRRKQWCFVVDISAKCGICGHAEFGRTLGRVRLGISWALFERCVKEGFRIGLSGVVRTANSGSDAGGCLA